MAPLIIVGYVISALSGLVHLGSDVAGLDLSIAQDQAGKAKLSTLMAPPAAVPPQVTAPTVPEIPPCPKLTATQDDDALNLIELNRVTGRCVR